ncbi:MAG: 3-deoxy-7-phosphoheptulonate synthase [Melioribacteraceae bacterium]|nr:3-deoxy-7-phosphoheptulonate synthase [Melioribacteraceae bacterium]
MIIILENHISEENTERIEKTLVSFGFQIHKSVGVERTIIGAVGVKPNFDTRNIRVMEGVADVYRITTPYKLAGRDFHEENTVINYKGVEIGGNKIVMMSGPCSVENEGQINRLAEIVAKSGAQILRGGAFKPRTSPYSFQGMGKEGLQLMRKAADNNNLLVVTEVMQNDQIDMIYKYTDIFQVGARNMQNFSMLKELGKVDKPILLKRGIAATLEELLMAAEYILSNGNPNVILCERGIRTFESYTRNTFDLSAIPVIHKKSHLPIIADPSHATGLRDQVPSMARAAVAAGADGLMIEIHDEPEKALSDGPQALLPVNYLQLISELQLIAQAIGRTL